MAVCLLYTFSLCLLQQGDQVGNIGVDIAVGQKTQEMHSLAGLSVIYQVDPCGRCEQAAIFNGFAYQLCTLRVNLAAAQSIVANLGVAHILIGRQTNDSAVSLQISMGTFLQKTV